MAVKDGKNKLNDAANVTENTENTTVDETNDGEVTGDENDTVAADAPKEKGSSPKSKKSRGVDPSLVTAWPPFDQTKADRDRLRKYAAVRGITIVAALQEMLNWAYVQYQEQIVDAVARYEANPSEFGGGGTAKPKKDLSTMSIDELEKEATRLKTQAEKQMNSVELAKQLIEKKRLEREALAANGG